MNNEDIYYNKDVIQLNSEGKFLYIRHGQTDYNKDSKLIDGDQMGKYEMKWDIKYLDCKLNEDGIKQSLNLSNKLNKLKIEKIYCSPLRRCLETALYSLSSHPQNKELEIIIVPLLCEGIHTIHDGSINILEKIEYYKDFNSHNKYIMNKLKDKSYNLNYNINWEAAIDFENIQKSYIKLYPKDKLLNFSFPDIIKKSFKEEGLRAESLPDVFNRTKEFKKYYLSVLNNNNNILKVLIFSHSGYIRCASLGINYHFPYTKENDSLYPKEVYYPGNCEVVSINPLE